MTRRRLFAALAALPFVGRLPAVRRMAGLEAWLPTEPYGFGVDRGVCDAYKAAMGDSPLYVLEDLPGGRRCHRVEHGDGSVWRSAPWHAEPPA